MKLITMRITVDELFNHKKMLTNFIKLLKILQIFSKITTDVKGLIFNFMQNIDFSKAPFKEMY